MAKGRTGRGVRKTATAGAMMNSVELLKRCGLALEAELAGISTTDKEPPERITLPSSVERALYNIQQQMFQINAMIASIAALAGANDCSSVVRCALEGVLRSFEPLLGDDLSRIVVSRAAGPEVSDGR